MANKKIAARSLGDDYQVYYFWLYALKMLQPNSKIFAVAYEKGNSSPFDDVAVYYSECRKNEYTDTFYDRDFFQCKFKVSDENSLKWEDLIDPDYYGNKESLLQRAFRLYNSESNKNFRLILCTSINFDNGDVFNKYCKCAEHGLDVNSMFAATDKKTVGMLNAVRIHLGNLNYDIMKDFLSHFRFYVGKSVHEIKIALQECCGISNIKYDLSKDAEVWTSILKRLNLRERTEFNKQSIQTICFNEKLFCIDRTEIGIIGISRIDERIDKLKSLGDNCLDLSNYFVDRKILPVAFWTNIIDDAKNFVRTKIKHGECFSVTLSAIFSVAFLLGKLIGFKKGDIALHNRNGLWIKSLAQPCLLLDSHEVYYSDKVGTLSDEIIISISVSNNSITKDVIEYMEKESQNFPLLSIHRRMDNITDNVVWDFADSCHNTVLDFLKRKKPKSIHLFYRGPAELMFILGQYANEWGECQIYDYEFEAALICDKKYFKGIKF